MRIASVCYWSVFTLDGVAKKVTTQVERWRAGGHDAEIFALTPPARGRAQAWPANAYAFASAFDRPRAAARLLQAIRRFAPDVVYLRYDLLPPPLHGLTRLRPTVVELNSDDQGEYAFRQRGASVARLYGSWNWRRLYSRAAGVVAVAHELLPLVDRYDRPAIVIGNGIDVDAIEPSPAGASGPPRLVFSGTPGQAWHGVDKIVELARARPDIEVTLVGAEPDASMPSNVTAHGYLRREQYEPLFAQADAAFGSAAFHRRSMREASPLKVREYLAYGLPVVLPYDDTDLRGVDDWWLLRVPNTEDNLLAAADEIVRFATAARGRRVPRSAIEPRVGAAAKEQARLEFLMRFAS